jgi:cytochrome c-type biogenesis protein CcmH
LAQTAPADAPWLTVVNATIADLSQQLGQPVPAAAPIRAAPGPSQADMAAAANMSGDDQQKMIRGMVAKLDQRLKDNPDDPDGWQRLGRAYGVLGDKDKSVNAYREAASRAPTRIELQLDYAHALFEPGAASAEPPPAFIEIMRHILTLDANQPEALWFIGRAEAASGHGKDAVALLTRLLAQLPPDAPVRGTVQKAIDQAKGS